MPLSAAMFYAEAAFELLICKKLSLYGFLFLIFRSNRAWPLKCGREKNVEIKKNRSVELLGAGKREFVSLLLI